MSSFAKGNPFSLFLGDPFFGTPCFLFFLFFLSPAKVGSLEMQPGAKLQAYLGVSILQPHACTQRFRLRIFRRTRSNAGRTSARSLSGRIESIWETPSAEKGSAPLKSDPLMWVNREPGHWAAEDAAVHGRLPWVDVTYCKYGTPYRKQTRLWTNTRRGLRRPGSRG